MTGSINTKTGFNKSSTNMVKKNCLQEEGISSATKSSYLKRRLYTMGSLVGIWGIEFGLVRIFTGTKVFNPPYFGGLGLATINRFVKSGIYFETTKTVHEKCQAMPLPITAMLATLPLSVMGVSLSNAKFFRLKGHSIDSVWLTRSLITMAAPQYIVKNAVSAGIATGLYDSENPSLINHVTAFGTAGISSSILERWVQHTRMVEGLKQSLPPFKWTFRNVGVVGAFVVSQACKEAMITKQIVHEWKIKGHRVN